MIRIVQKKKKKNLHLYAHQELSLALSMMFDKLSAGTKVPLLLEIF